MIASRRSRNRSVLPDDGRDGRIAKTPENARPKPQSRYFPILRYLWESLEKQTLQCFSGPTKETAGRRVLRRAVPLSLVDCAERDAVSSRGNLDRMGFPRRRYLRM